MNGSTDLTMTASFPTDLRWTDTIVELVGSAADPRSLTIDRAADIQTATFEAFVDTIERCDAPQIHLAVDRTATGLTIRLSGDGSDWHEESSVLAQRVISVLADRAVFGPESVELEFLS